MKITFRSLILLFSLTLVSSFSKSQVKNEFITRLKVQLLYYRSQNIIQTIAIQTDKSLYRPGEEIWVKAYVTDALTHKLSLKSSELIVHLIDQKGKLINSANFRLRDGKAAGSLSIPNDAGNDLYSMVAWTPEMVKGSNDHIILKDIYICRVDNLNLVPKIEYADTLFSPESKVTATLSLKDLSGKPLSGKNFDYQVSEGDIKIQKGKNKTSSYGKGEIVFKTPVSESGKPLIINTEISAGKEKINLVSHIPLTTEKINIRFFPEGGNIVPGIPQRVVFKAVDQLGKPVNIDADIVSDKGEIIAKTTPIQTGLGLFNMIIPENSGYKFRINSSLGKGQETGLPASDSSGMSISIVKNDGQNMDLLLRRSPGSTHSNFLVFTLNNGEINWANEFELEQTGIIKIPLDYFESEIGAVVIFNQNGTLAGQRLVYTGKKSEVNISVNPDHSSYSKNEEGNVKVKLTGTDGKPVNGEFSVSISDNSTRPINEDISYDLNFGLKDPILFDKPLDQMNKTFLDYYLIASQLKGIDWDNILSIDPSKPETVISGGHEVPGKGVDYKGNPIMKNSMIDEVVHLKNNNNRINEWKFLESYQRSDYFRENPDFLKVNLLGKGPSGDNISQKPNWKIYLEGGGTLFEAIRMIHRCHYIWSDNNNCETLIFGTSVNFFMDDHNDTDGALIVIDGQKMGICADVLNQIDPGTIEDLKVLFGADEITKYTGFNSIGVIEITTKRGTGMGKTTEAENNQNKKPIDSFIPRPLGNEKYNLLTTLQWIPDLLTDENGEATIKFKTGNVKSTFILDIIGHTEKGKWIEKQVELPVR